MSTSLIARTYNGEVTPSLGQGPTQLVVTQVQYAQLHEHVFLSM